ncbi:hypothetical protein DPMN_069596 [Dreissena polymorpha]|uniref:SRCR domain-containing protein n=1 Tax=Dreissena polymorpha TaxID=45954 RepID=A0A9D3YZT6_DREPO|nr:hypothetical protein DPMN_069596 [Dreissena polymorpha]
MVVDNFNRLTCRLKEFTCSDGQCVGASSVCDSHCHCGICDDEHNCTSWRIRLVNGTHYFGRVDLTTNRLTGTVCDRSWDNSDATVVCKSLGFRFGHSVPRGYYGYGTGPIWLDDVDCTGDETALSSCRHGGLGVSNCEHTNDAGVICMNDMPTVPKQVTGPLTRREDYILVK